MEVRVISEFNGWLYIGEFFFFHTVGDFIGCKGDTEFHKDKVHEVNYGLNNWRYLIVFLIFFNTWNHCLTRTNGCLRLHLLLEVSSWKSPASSIENIEAGNEMIYGDFMVCLTGVERKHTSGDTF